MEYRSRPLHPAPGLHKSASSPTPSRQAMARWAASVTHAAMHAYAASLLSMRVKEPSLGKTPSRMSSSNRWTRASAAEAQASSSSRRRPEFPDSQYDDEVIHSSPPGGYTTRKVEVIPPEDQRNPRTLAKEDHMAFCAVQDIDMRQHGFKLRRD